MYYEVYVDILFIENLWMNVMLLFLTAWADHAQVRTCRIVIAAAAGSLGACLLTITSAWLSGAGYFLGNACLALGMVKIAFPGIRHLGVRTLLLYAECFVMSGVLRYLGQFHRLGGVWFAALSSISFLFLTVVEYIGKRRKEVRAQVYSVTLCLDGYRMTVEALYDTGNSLCDPISGQPVNVLDSRLLDQILQSSEKEHLPGYIPYHTISQTGILETYVLDRMELEVDGEKRQIVHPRVARMPEGNREFGLILHRGTLSS